MTSSTLFGLVIAALPGAAAMAGPDLRIEHRGLRCVVAERPPVLTARFDPPAAVGRARAYFRAGGGRHWYYVEMHPAADGFRAQLPRPLRSTSRIVYYLEALDRSFSPVRTGEFMPVVASGPGACREDVAAAPVAADLVVGSTEGAPPLPQGFLSEGLVPAGSTGVSGPAAAATGGGPGPIVWIAGVAAVGAAAGAIAMASNAGDEGESSVPSNPRSRDDDGDGLSEDGGDCNDTNPAVRPGGGFEFTATFPYTGAVECRQSPPATSSLRIANNDCSPLSYTLVFQQTILGFPPESEGRYPGTVAAGTTETRMLFGDPASSFLCCRNSPCGGGNVMEGRETWTIETPFGTRTVSNSFNFVIGTCPACGN